MHHLPLVFRQGIDVVVFELKPFCERLVPVYKDLEFWLDGAIEGQSIHALCLETRKDDVFWLQIQ